jgi:purine-nucleoside phosphorylase
MEQFSEAVNYLRSKGVTAPEVGIVLGTGLGGVLDNVEVSITIPYTDIPGFPAATVEFHKGNLIYGTISGKKVLVMQGRFHHYEGYSMQQIVFPVRVMKLLGIKNLFLSNAAGGINPKFKKGDLVLLDDHINLQPGNPLTGKNEDELGGRFPDMSQPYNKALNDLIKAAAVKEKIDLHEGVYSAVIGPNLETRAEYRYLKIIGADMVGMSTVPEVIAANHMQLPCAAISVITDECDPDNLKPVDIAEIIAVAGKADEKVARVLKTVMQTI